MVVTLQQVGVAIKDYIISKLASSYTGIKRAALCVGAELLSGYVVNNGMQFKTDLTLGAGLFTSKNNIDLEQAKAYLKNAMQECGAFSIELPFGLPVVTIEPSDVDELYNILRPLATNENKESV